MLYYTNMKKFITEKIKYVILLLAIAMCLLGVHIGETEVVLKKAVKICLECCGIG